MKLAKEKLCVLCKEKIPRADTWLNRKVYIPEHNVGLPISDIEAFLDGNIFHWNCYLAWDNFADFALQQFRFSCEKAKKDYFRGVLFQNEMVLVSVSIAEPYSLYFALSQTGSRISLSLQSWEEISFYSDFCLGVFYPCFLHPFEEKAFRKVFPLLASLFPNRTTIAQETDWSGTEYHLYVPLH